MKHVGYNKIEKKQQQLAYLVYQRCRSLISVLKIAEEGMARLNIWRRRHTKLWCGNERIYVMIRASFLLTYKIKKFDFIFG